MREIGFSAISSTGRRRLLTEATASLGWSRCLEQVARHFLRLCAGRHLALEDLPRDGLAAARCNKIKLEPAPSTVRSCRGRPTARSSKLLSAAILEFSLRAGGSGLPF
jgi:hypothetical protein